MKTTMRSVPKLIYIFAKTTLATATAGTVTVLIFTFARNFYGRQPLVIKISVNIVIASLQITMLKSLRSVFLLHMKTTSESRYYEDHSREFAKNFWIMSHAPSPSVATTTSARILFKTNVERLALLPKEVENPKRRCTTLL